LASPYVFMDEKAVVKIAAPPIPDELPYELKTITRQGFGPTQMGKVRVANGSIQITPLTEGIHILDLKSTSPQTLRFLVAIKRPVCACPHIPATCSIGLLRTSDQVAAL
jgi:hypothetical protein